MDNEYVASKLKFKASKYVGEIVRSLGQTEDVKFSPSGSRLAVANYGSDTITIFDISITGSQNSKQIDLINAAVISSSDLKRPHGLDFIDDEKIIVTNREGQVHIFEMPVNTSGRHELKPFGTIQSDLIFTPGSIAVCRKEQNIYEALICNNYADRVTRHLFDLEGGVSTHNSEVLLKKWIAFPDSIAVSRDNRWIAISNHRLHAIFIYKNDRSLNPNCDPAGVLRSHYPHGLRFTTDNRFILAASAGSPYVTVYKAEDSDWRGLRVPVLSVRVLSNDEFFHGRYNRQEGGPKGVDVNYKMGVLVTGCEMEPLAFFDWATIQDACIEKNLVYRSGKKLRYAPNSVATLSELYRYRAVAAIRWILWKVSPLSWALNKLRSMSRVPKPY